MIPKRRVMGVILSAWVCLVICCYAGTLGGPSIAIYTDRDTYWSGKTIEVRISGKNFGEAMWVSVYVGLLTPDGCLYIVDSEGWSTQIQAWIPDIYVPSSFDMDPTPCFWFDVPCSMPPIEVAGRYSFACVLARVGEFDWVCDVAFAPFNVTGPPWQTDVYIDAAAGSDDNDGASWGSAWRTIGHGLEHVEGTEERPVVIHVASGTYSPSSNGESFPLVMKSFVSLLGESPETTILDAEWTAYHVVFCKDAHRLTIERFTITGGSANGSADEEWQGGGIYCEKSSPTIRDNEVAGNHAIYGGGICILQCWRPRTPTIENNVISANSGRWGGGIYCYDSSPWIMGNKITDNPGPSAHSACWGAGIYLEACVRPVVANNTITCNSASYDGGGIECDGSSPDITNNLITDNEANHLSGRGGAVCCWWGSSPRIRANTIVGNSGGLYYGYGGGIHCWESSSPTIIDCIIWGNGDDLYDCSATYCCIEDGDSGTGNIHEDPMFVSGPLGDYYLHPNSACINAGSRSAEEAGLSDRTTQGDGTPDTEIVDMGFHYRKP